MDIILQLKILYSMLLIPISFLFWCAFIGLIWALFIGELTDKRSKDEVVFKIIFFVALILSIIPTLIIVF